MSTILAAKPASGRRTARRVWRTTLTRCLSAGLALALWSAPAAATNHPALFNVGSFNRRITTGTQTITHNLGTAATAIVIWTANKTGTTFASDYQFGIGMTDGTTSESMSIAAADGTNARRRRIDTPLFHLTDTAGTVVVSGTLSSNTSNTFVINWGTVDGVAADMHYLVIAGTKTKAKVLSWNAPSGTDSSYNVTGVGFKPTTVLNFWEGYSQTGALPAASTAAIIGMGAMDMAGHQWANSVATRDTLNPVVSYRRQLTTAAIFLQGDDGAIPPTLTVKKQASFVSMDSDGFTMNFSTSDSSTTDILSLALQGLNQQVGTFNKTTGTSQPAVSPGWQPGLLLLSSFQDLTQAATTTQSRYGFGASDGTNEASTAFTDKYNTSTVNTDAIESTTKCFMKDNNNTPSVEASADATFSSTGYSLTWSASDTDTTQIGYVALGTPSGTEAKLDDFEARADPGGVQFDWRTGFEVDNLGFYLHRERNGVRTRISPAMIAGSALLVGGGTPLSAGRSYSWRLPGADPGSSYWLEEVDLHGKSVWHGPVRAQLAAADVVPPLSASLLDRLGQPAAEPGVKGAGDVPVSLSLFPARPIHTRADRLVQLSLAAGPAVKIAVRRDGLYHLVGSDLLAAGLDPGVDPRRLHLYLEGQELPILVSGEADGRLDPTDTVDFYGVAADTPYVDTSTYWLAAGDGPGRRMTSSSPPEGAARATSFPFTIELKDRSIYFAALQNGDEENFFGPVIAGAPVDQIVPVHHLIGAPGATAELRVALQGVSAGAHQVAVALNGVSLGTVELAERDRHETIIAVPVGPGGLVEGDNKVTLTAVQGAADVTLLDRITLTYAHAFTADADALRFSLDDGSSARIEGFSTGDVRTYDVTDPRAVRQITSQVVPGSSGYAATVTASGGGSRTLLAVTPARLEQGILHPNAASTWNANTNGAEMVIIAHGSLTKSAEALRDLRRQQGRTVAIVDVEDLYDEFNFGDKSPYAIRAFLARAQSTWTVPPRFVVLLGDATLDPRDHRGKGDFDLVPTKLVETSLLETASDDWFAAFHATGVPEMAIGRIPARTPDQADAIIAKIVAHDTVDRPEQNQVVVFTDQSSTDNDFAAASRAAVAALPPWTPLQMLSADDPEIKTNLVAALDAGPMVVNYLGHGYQGGWRAGAFDSSAAQTLTNLDRPSLFLNMTCLNGFFQDVDAPALAEVLLSAPRGGALAVWASSGVTEALPQSVLNQRFLEASLNEGLTIGESAMLAKAATDDPDVRSTWILFGDPSTSLRPAKLASVGAITAHTLGCALGGREPRGPDGLSWSVLLGSAAIARLARKRRARRS